MPIEKYDLYFLDIHMPKFSGLDIATAIRSENKQALIVFLTNYSEYMPQVFQYQTFDYLIKPINEAKLNKLMERIDQIIVAEHFSFTINGEHFSIKDVDILYFEKKGRYVLIKTTYNKEYQVRMTNTQLKQKLNDNFVQIHTSFIINLHYFHSLKSNLVSLSYFDDTSCVSLPEFPVSRKFRKEVSEKVIKKIRGGNR